MKIAAEVGAQVFDVRVERRAGVYAITIDGKQLIADVHKLEANFYTILVEGRSFEVSVEATGDGYRVRHGAAEQLVRFGDPSRRAREELAGPAGPERVVSVMPGKIARVLVAVGDEVEAGQGLVVVEAMKMENEVTAGRAGRVTSLPVAPGHTVEGGSLLAVIE